MALSHVLHTFHIHQSIREIFKLKAMGLCDRPLALLFFRTDKSITSLLLLLCRCIITTLQYKHCIFMNLILNSAASWGMCFYLLLQIMWFAVIVVHSLRFWED